MRKREEKMGLKKYGGREKGMKGKEEARKRK